MEPKMTRVVKVTEEKCDVYIGRPSKWGNPFRIGGQLKRDRAIELYERYVRITPHLLTALPELKGKVLGCHCAPLPCHGDVLVKLIKEMEDGQNAPIPPA
jgi:hypothetical protein